MSCVPESLVSVYVDGELEPEEVRRVEAHLIGCERCRRTVLALREETRLLTDVLHERPLPQRVAGTDGAAARGLLTGGTLALAAGAAVVAVLGVLLESRLPSGAGWLHPARLFGVTDMLFGIPFMLRDRAPGLVEFGAAVAATASVAALGASVAGALVRRVSGTLALGASALLLAAPPARAGVEFRHDEPVHVRAGETLAGTLVMHGETLRIDGVVDGNVAAFTEHLDVRGTVTGSVFTFAQRVEVSGRIGGGLFGGVEDLRVEGAVDGPVVVGFDHFRLERDATLAGDLVLAGDDALVEGRVGRDVLGYLREVELSGEVGRDVELLVDELRVEPGAVIAGALRAHVESAEVVSVDPAAQVGAVETILVERRLRGGWQRYARAGFWLWWVVQLGAAFLVGMGVFALAPRLFEGALPTGRAFLAALGWGFAALLVTPVALVLVALTLVGLPAALIGAALYLLAIYLAWICVAALVGFSLTRPATDFREFGLALAVGLLVLGMAAIVPVLGPLVRVVVVLAGLGLLLQRGLALWRTSPRRGEALRS